MGHSTPSPVSSTVTTPKTTTRTTTKQSTKASTTINTSSTTQTTVNPKITTTTRYDAEGKTTSSEYQNQDKDIDAGALVNESPGGISQCSIWFGMIITITYALI